MPDKKDLPGFKAPVDLPKNEEQRVEWQKANAEWWGKNPMRYDVSDAVNQREFTKEFYAEIDRRFFTNASEFLPHKKLPFDTLIPFDELPNLDVLEIGVGSGSHAQLIAKHARSFTGIDLTEYAVRSTGARLAQFGIRANILQMDAEKLKFPDSAFDFVWSWGVIHHSANTREVLKEIHRVLKPGGKAIIMVYHRSFWFYYVLAGFFWGVLRGQLIRHRSVHAVAQNIIDGALARYYTPKEWTAIVGDLFKIDEMFVCGQKAELVPIPGSRFKTAILNAIPNSFSRFFTNRLKMGYFLVSRLSKS
jgi:ubiquinone/menaquinone biosynthesis C-methylase UbiE